MYGYEIVQEIGRASQGAVTPGEGVIYPLLHALEKDGALKAEARRAGGRTRIYYSLTAKGVRRLFDLTDDWSRMVRAVRVKRVTPSSSSRSWICLLSGGWETCNRSAARVTFSSSATTTK